MVMKTLFLLSLILIVTPIDIRSINADSIVTWIKTSSNAIAGRSVCTISCIANTTASRIKIVITNINSDDSLFLIITDTNKPPGTPQSNNLTFTSSNSQLYNLLVSGGGNGKGFPTYLYFTTFSIGASNETITVSDLGTGNTAGDIFSSLTQYTGQIGFGKVQFNGTTCNHNNLPSCNMVLSDFSGKNVFGGITSSANFTLTNGNILNRRPYNNNPIFNGTYDLTTINDPNTISGTNVNNGVWAFVGAVLDPPIFDDTGSGTKGRGCGASTSICTSGAGNKWVGMKGTNDELVMFIVAQSVTSVTDDKGTNWKLRSSINLASRTLFEYTAFSSQRIFAVNITLVGTLLSGYTAYAIHGYQTFRFSLPSLSNIGANVTYTNIQPEFILAVGVTVAGVSPTNNNPLGLIAIQVSNSQDSVMWYTSSGYPINPGTYDYYWSDGTTVEQSNLVDGILPATGIRLQVTNGAFVIGSLFILIAICSCLNMVGLFGTPPKQVFRIDTQHNKNAIVTVVLFLSLGVIVMIFSVLLPI